MKKYGLSKTMPRGEARPLGTPRPKPARRQRTAVAHRSRGRSSLATNDVQTAAPAAEQKIGSTAESAGHRVVAEVESSVSVGSTRSPMTAPGLEKDTKDTTMILTLKGYNKKGNAAVYVGGKSSIRIANVNFKDKIAPDTLSIDDAVLAASVKEPKVKMTAEERKAARAAKPKPTLAEKAAAAKRRSDALAAELNAEQAGM